MTANQYKGKRNTVTFPTEMWETINNLAENETRTFSQMVVQLCSEALKVRKSNESK